jgi:hypothetical protein
MVLVAVTVVCALIAGRVRGGRLRHLAALPFTGGVLVLVAAISQVLFALAPSRVAAIVLTVVSQAALLTFLWLNRYLPGALLIAVGSSLNTVVVLANGAMPVARDAMIAIGRHPAELAAGRHRLLTDTDALPRLADVIALPLLQTIVSVGDIVLAAGLGLLVVSAMATPRPDRSASADALS